MILIYDWEYYKKEKIELKEDPQKSLILIDSNIITTIVIIVSIYKIKIFADEWLNSFFSWYVIL